ncbi:hypothetical protein [Chamaesiphon polymorphus]|uniref:Toprim domain-containing protein n=1 Tax=Chamaesiphon polymorphus CCALA 037 TaxID=2107692 RepID=A0A2T1GHB6_9CYAN|nr:hypothetical protein [Chamaesiphon polymorphus]PSB57063.1 hypothetical protein C7B77_09695 [Chamaesiphon polymorphus CCALA 037]
MTSHSSREPFAQRPLEGIVLANYKHLLTNYRRYQNRYWCPACGCHNLTFSPEGKWMCWNDPTREHRLEIMARLVPDFKQSKPRQSESISHSIVPSIHPQQLGYPLMTDEVLSEVRGNRTIYRYSPSQRVMRIDWVGDKSIFPQHFNGKEWVNGAGSLPWCVYGLSRLLPYPNVVNLILVVEGQKCVEIGHRRGIPALCFQGGDYSNQTTFDKLRAIKAKFARSLLVVLPDFDLAGNYKANRIIHTARYFNLPTLLLDPLQIEPALQVGGDIEQMERCDRNLVMQVVRSALSTRFTKK